MGDIVLSHFDVRVRFESDADLARWPGDVLRSGFGARLRALVCAARPGPGAPRDCTDCQLAGICVYDFFYNSRPPDGARVLRKQRDIPRPFVFDPPLPGRYSAGSTSMFGFTLLGRGIDHMPYFLVALRNLGESGMSRGYRKGCGRFTMESVDSIGYGRRVNIFSGGRVFNRAIFTDRYAQGVGGSQRGSHHPLSYTGPDKGERAVHRDPDIPRPHLQTALPGKCSGRVLRFRDAL